MNFRTKRWLAVAAWLVSMLSALFLSGAEVGFRFASVVLVSVLGAGLALAYLLKIPDLTGSDRPSPVSQDAPPTALATLEIAASAIGEKSVAITEDIERVQVLLNEAIAQLLTSFGEIESHLATEGWVKGKNGKVLPPSGFAAAAGEASSFKSLQDSVAQAVVSLQFQDMVSQLLGHVVTQVSRISEIAEAGEVLAQRLRAAPREDAALSLSEFREQLQAVLQKTDSLSKKLDNNPVAQTGIRSGEVELF